MLPKLFLAALGEDLIRRTTTLEQQIKDLSCICGKNNGYIAYCDICEDKTCESCRLDSEQRIVCNKHDKACYNCLNDKVLHTKQCDTCDHMLCESCYHNLKINCRICNLPIIDCGKDDYNHYAVIKHKHCKID